MLKTAFWCALPCVAIVLIAGCVSTEERFEKGVKLEQEGRYEEAASHYIRVLRKEPEYEGARERLAFVAEKVVDGYQLEARDLLSSGAAVRSADAIRRMFSFTSGVESVGVDVPVPDSVFGFQDRVEIAAVDQLLGEAELASSEGRWQASINFYRRAVDRGILTEERAEDIRQEQLAVEVFWAESLISSGKPRGAYGHAQIALDGGLSDPEMKARARALQAEALRLGTRRVAVLPVGARESVRREATTELVVDMNDLLAVDHWTRPPLFVAVADPVGVRREFRQLKGRGYAIASKGDALEIGRIVDAEWVAVVEMERFDRAEKELKTRTATARVKGRSGADTTYHIIDTEITLSARIAFRIYEVRSRLDVYQAHFDTGVTDRIERGRFSGDYRVLDLSGRELDFFDEDEHVVRILRLEEELVRAASDQLAQRLFDQVLIWIP
jgi:tetratricopeptide (TPR) repeat protein